MRKPNATPTARPNPNPNPNPIPDFKPTPCAGHGRPGPQNHSTRCNGLIVGAIAQAFAAQAMAASPATPSLGALQRLSYLSPFTNCRADHIAQQDGVNYHPSVVEPFLAADPTRPGHLLAGAQQDRWSNGGARGLVSWNSPFYGRLWNRSVPSGLSQCSGGRLPRASDAWVSIGPEGIAYFFTLAFSDTESAMLASRSADGGKSWAAPIAVIDDTDPSVFDDKNSITADPAIKGMVYAVWDRLSNAPADDRGGVMSPGGMAGGAAARARGLRGDGVARALARIAELRARTAHPNAVTGIARPATSSVSYGPTYFARSINAGLSWSAPAPIYDPGPNAQTIGNVILASSKGAIHDLFTRIDAAGNLTIQSITSTNQGTLWNQPVPVAAYHLTNPTTPDSKSPIRSASITPGFAIAPQQDTLYAVWQDVPAAGAPVVIRFAQSLDGGQSWSAPISINQTPANANPLRAQAFTPAITVAGDGTLAVSYTDFRNDTGQAGEWADVWAVFCTPSTSANCASAAAWGRELRLTPASFNYANAPSAGTGYNLYFLGDYSGLAAQGKHVWAVFAAAGSKGTSYLLSREIDLP